MSPDAVAIDLLASALSSGTFEYLNNEGKEKVRAEARELLDQIDNARTRNAATLRDLVDPTLAHRAVEGVFRREDITGGDAQSNCWHATRAVLDLPATVPAQPGEVVGYIGAIVRPVDGVDTAWISTPVTNTPEAARSAIKGLGIKATPEVLTVSRPGKATPEPAPAPEPVGWVSLAIHDRHIEGGQAPVDADERHRADRHSEQMTIEGSKYSTFRTYKIVEA